MRFTLTVAQDLAEKTAHYCDACINIKYIVGECSRGDSIVLCVSYHNHSHASACDCQGYIIYRVFKLTCESALEKKGLNPSATNTPRSTHSLHCDLFSSPAENVEIC